MSLMTRMEWLKEDFNYDCMSKIAETSNIYQLTINFILLLSS